MTEKLSNGPITSRCARRIGQKFRAFRDARRDLRSAVVSFAALMDSSPAHVSLDLAAIRSVLDLMVPIQAKVSRKRWANLRSDLSAAIAASGSLQMLKTSTIELSGSWASLLGRRRTPNARRSFALCSVG